MKISKICNRCNIEKKLEDFYADKISLDGRYTICKVCKNQCIAKWRNENREKYNAGMRLYGKKHRRKIHLHRTYDLTLDQYNEMLQKQNNVCWICLRNNPSKKRPLAIDHNHKTGKVRGLLCYGCNRALHTLETPELLQRAMVYLQSF